jgi:hypothetical protein
MGEVFKHMNVPEYDAKNAAHVALSKLVEKSHNEHNAAKRACLVTQVETDGETVAISTLRFQSLSDYSS